jgi:radical SAM-linked protein
LNDLKRFESLRKNSVLMNNLFVVNLPTNCLLKRGLMKKRIFFNKTGELTYISHLDLMRFMERLFRIAGIKIEYSSGFHPRPKYAFGNPVSMGMETFNEPMDIDVSTELSNDEILERLNGDIPPGLIFTEVRDLNAGESIARDYNIVNYEFKFEDKSDAVLFYEMISREKLIVSKIKDGKESQQEIISRIARKQLTDNNIYISLNDASPKQYITAFKAEFGEEKEDNIKIARTGYDKI